jgi:aspartyl-tRNA(Asn)/glutamyl-tRNA(Gln) amidotransferase subunit A
LFVTGAAARLGPFLAQRPDDIEENLRALIVEGQQMAPDAYYRAWLAKNDWWQEVRRMFDRYDVLVTPTVACQPFAVGSDTVGDVAGKPVSFYGWMPFTVPFNLTGQPAISVPAGFTAAGLPVGMQIIGRRLADSTVLALAAAYERHAPWATQVPPIVISEAAQAVSPAPQ